MADGGGWQVPDPGSPSRGGAEGLRARLAELRAVAMDLAVDEHLSVDQAAEIIDLATLIDTRFGDGSSPRKAEALAGLIEALTCRLLLEARRREGERDAGIGFDPEPAAPSRPRPGVGRPLLAVTVAASSVCAVLSLVAAGLASFPAGPPDGSPPRAFAPEPAIAVSPPASPVARGASREPRAAQTPEPGAEARAPSAAPGPDLGQVSAALTRGEPWALTRLSALARAGDPGAQSRLAALYETGGAGLRADLQLARDWTRRAAEGGDRLAMHNFALFLSKGEGGRRDPAAAAVWFRRAAQRGVVDAQYNLGRIYEDGRGVSRNLREAYRWYAIAAQAGDLAARERAVELESRLAPTERASLDRAVAAFEPGPAAPPDDAPVIAPATTVAETQALLARQGYYVGPIDGLASPALSGAARAYLADQQSDRPPA